MKSKRLLNKVLFTIVLFCFTIIPLWAQEDFGDDTNDTGPPPASIDIYASLLLLGAIGLGCYVLNRKVKTSKD